MEGRSRASAPALRTFTILCGSAETQQEQRERGAREHMDVSQTIHKENGNW